MLIPTLRSRVPAHKLRLFEMAVSDSECEVPFYVHKGDKSMNSTVAVDPVRLATIFPHDDPKAIEETRVTTTTLDSALSDDELQDLGPGLLKVDTQGNELDVLRGAKSVLKHIASCLVEHMFADPYERDYTFEDVVDFMRDCGYSCAGPLCLCRRSDYRVTKVDFLFVKAIESHGAVP